MISVKNETNLLVNDNENENWEVQKFFLSKKTNNLMSLKPLAMNWKISKHSFKHPKNC